MTQDSVVSTATTTSAKGSAVSLLYPDGGYAPFLALSPAWERRIALLIVLVQAVWAIVVPIKNVAMMSNPVFRADSTDTENSAYTFVPKENATIIVPGRNIVPLLQRVLSIVLDNRVIRENFESVGSFDLDTAYQLLSPEDFHVISQYYALVFQATEFPGGVMTPRAQHFRAAGNESELPADALGVWIRPTDPDQSDWFLRLSCSAENSKLDGTRCFQGNSSDVCFDFPKKGDVRRYESVSLELSRNNSGMANNIGLLFLIEDFQSTMTALFSTKSWKKTLESVQFVTNVDAALNNAFSSVYGADGRPLVAEKYTATFSLPTSLMQTKNLESCAISEVIGARFYTKAFVVQLIQSALVKYDLYNPEEALMQPPNQTEVIVSSILNFDLVLTSGARYAPLSDTGSKRFVGVTLATVDTASMHLKLDKKLNGEQVFGSSIRMLEYMTYYPEYYSYLTHELKIAAGEPFDQVNLSILGGGTSGLFTFKNNWWGNTMQVYRLRERPSNLESVARVDPWWDDEAKFALWFEKLERTSEAPYRMFDKYMDIAPHQVVRNDNPATACHRAFFKALTKVAFLSLLSITQLPSYLVFMSNINGATAWFKTTMRKSELYGETIDGTRRAFSYSLDAVTHRDDGSAWVVVPLLHAMLQEFNRSEVLRMLTVEFNQSFASLVATEYGLVHFSDMAQCKIGFAKNNVSDEDNTMDKVMDKLYPSVVSFFSDLLDLIPTLRSKMKVDLENAGDNAVQMVDIRQEMIKGSPSGPANVASSGSPVFWTPTAFTVGMLKFWPAVTPPSSVIEAYRNATTCYDTLETRYLNESVRCWVEPNNVLKTRVEHKSILMGKIIFSIWSTSLVLNLIASFIAASFIWRLVKAWRITKFRCVNIWVALQLNFQGFGVLSFPEIVLLMLSTIPLLLGYHIPVDNVFITGQDTQHIPKACKDFIVTLSASWFYRFGFEIANQFIVLREISFWFSNFRLRLLSMLTIFILRIATPDKMHSSEYELAKLLLTCSLSMLMGVASVLAPVFGQRSHRSNMIQPMEAKSQSIVVASINKHGMPLNKYGLVGFSRRGWSLTGLIVEGWEVVKHKSKNRWVAVKGVCRIPLGMDENGDIKSIL